jgi:hypothetical protein
VRAVAPGIRAQRGPERRADAPPSNVALPSVAAPVAAPASCPMPSAADVAAREAVLETYMLSLRMIDQV